MEQPATTDPLIGATIGNYEVKSKLGEGGMGAVYMAEHPLIGKRVALKVLHSEFSGKEDVVSRFFHEAKAVNDIQHPNIVDIVDYGVIPNSRGQNTVYFIMEFLDGPSLSELLKREAPLVPERALAIGLQIADALAACHRSGVVHRDLKPDNIMLIQRGRDSDFAKILDFGIAKLTGEQKVSVRTRTGLLMGTPAYMSPEQCEGSSQVDHRTDIYALGILLYEMLTGQVPFSGETYGQILLQHLTQLPVPPSTVRGVIPPQVEAVVLKALEKHPDARYQSMDELVQALADPAKYVESHGGIAAFLGHPVDAMGRPMSGATPMVTPSGQVLHVAPDAISSAMPPPAPPRPRRRAAFIAATCLLVIGGTAAGAWWMNRAEGQAGSGSEPSVAAPVVIETGAPGSGGEPGAARTGAEQAPAAAPETEEPEMLAAPRTDESGEPAAADPIIEFAAEEVSVHIVSRPEGARVFVDGSDEPRGRTPLRFTVPKSSEEMRVTLHLDGYKKATRQFEPDSNKEFELRLQRERRTRVRRRQRRDRDRQNRTRQVQRGSDSSGGDTGDKNRNTRIDEIQEDVGLEDPFQ